MDCLSRVLLAAALAIVSGPAGVAAQATDGAETITPVDIARHIRVIADDSMRGRDTPSRGLESTARYVADQFERIGLTRLFHTRGPDRQLTWFLRYRIPFDLARSAVVFAAGGQEVAAGLTTAARFPFLEIPTRPARASTLLVVGQHTPEALQRLSLEGKTVLYVPQRGVADSGLYDLQDQLDFNLIALTDDSATFARHIHDGIAPFSPQRYSRSDKGKWIVDVLPAAAPALQALLATLGVNLPRLRADSTPVVRELPSLQVALDVRFAEGGSDTTTAPDVVGIIEGSDSALKNQYVAFSAHMDGRGATPGRADSIDNGADDNASGTAALIALAKAFNQPGARPRRSVLFVATSGGAKPDLWGSRAFVDTLSQPDMFDPRKRDVVLKVVAAVNLDMIGGGPPDSVMVDGLRAMNFKSPPDWVAAVHQELRLAVVDGGSVFRPESDHFSFATTYQTIPSLSFHNGRHGDRRPAPDLASKVNAEQVARIAQLVFHMSREIIDSAEIPHWTGEGRRQMTEIRR